jgi:hypothetical protein
LKETGNRFIFALPLEDDQPKSIPMEQEEDSGP